MRQIAQSLMPPARKRRAPPHRGKSIFVRDPLLLSTPMDREARHKLLCLAEAVERRTKAKGRKNGAIGQIGLQVLRALLGFANKATGLCYPSYFALQRATGLSRGSIRAALRRLEAAGIISVIRRLKRVQVVRMSPLTGQPEEIITTVQDSNLYAFTLPARLAERIDAFVKVFVPEVVARCARQLSLIAGLMRRLATESPR
jgi:DNA-binding transcriptional ArsR family regulator